MNKEREQKLNQQSRLRDADGNSQGVKRSLKEGYCSAHASLLTT